MDVFPTKMNTDERLSDYQIFEMDCSFRDIVREMELRGVRRITYQRWVCYRIGFSNYTELQFIEHRPLAAPATTVITRYGRPQGLPAALGCDGMRMWWEPTAAFDRSAYTAYEVKRHTPHIALTTGA